MREYENHHFVLSDQYSLHRAFMVWHKKPGIPLFHCDKIIFSWSEAHHRLPFCWYCKIIIFLQAREAVVACDRKMDCVSLRVFQVLIHLVSNHGLASHLNHLGIIINSD